MYQYLKPILKIVKWEKFAEVYKKSRDEVKVALINSAASHNRYLYIQRTLENFNIDFSPEIVYEATQRYWNYIIKYSRLFPHVLETLKVLRRNHIKIAIVTDLTADIQNLKMIKLNISKYINYMVTSEEVGVDKPNPKMIKLAIQKMGLKKNEVIMVGNNPKADIQVAKNYGIPSVLFDYYNKYPQEERNGADYYITNFSNLLDILGQNKRKYSNEKLVVFDMMGTLTTEPHIISVTMREVLPNMDYKKVKEEYEKFKINKISREEFWNNIGVMDIQKIEEAFLKKLKLKDGIEVVLNKIKKYSKLAILSNCPKEWGAILTKKFNLNKYFDAVVFSGDYGVKKPDSPIYAILLQKFQNIAPENVLLVDDDLEDLRSGKNYLMDTVWIKSDQKKSYYVPDYVIDKIEEVIKILKSKK